MEPGNITTVAPPRRMTKADIGLGPWHSRFGLLGIPAAESASRVGVDSVEVCCCKFQKIGVRDGRYLLKLERESEGNGVDATRGRVRRELEGKALGRKERPRE